MAPSPTGYLHLGSARTALYNWLFARQTGGIFMLRLEDTDRERSKQEYEEDILKSLSWLGIKSDEPVVRQSEHFDRYRTYAEQLLKESRAYTEPGKQGTGEAIILKKPGGDIGFVDRIRGEITFKEKELNDVVLIKSDGSPSYNFSVVVDDHDMDISHVIRGEDHISNTPKQLAVYEAFGWQVPVFAHIPLVLATDRSKLSKRHGAVSVGEYQARGYLPEALMNFLALLGWNPGTEQEIFTREELIRAFDLARVQKGGAVFDQKKLDWINEQHLKRLDAPELKEQLRLFLDAYRPELRDIELSNRLVEMSRSRIHTLADIENEIRWLQRSHYDTSLLSRDSNHETAKQHLERLSELLSQCREEDYDPAILETKLMPYANEWGRGAVLWPLRVALSGAEKSPSPFELLALLGKNESLERIKSALQKLSASG